LKYRIIKFAALVLPVLLTGCQKATPVAASHAAPDHIAQVSDVVPHQRDADDAARFLAGLPGKPGSSFLPLEEKPAWQEHRKLMDAAWAAAEDKLVHGLREFQQRELSGGPLDRTLFYPFSGPDVLTATVCFPKSPDFVMVALEPAGTLPTPSLLGKKDLATYLGGVRTTVASELGKSFFVTREMDRQFRGQVTDGLVTPMLLLLARTEHTILGLKYVRIDEEGKVADRPGGVPVEAPYANKGFELEFSSDTDRQPHRLYYFSLNLGNQKVRGNLGFQKYVESIPHPTTLLKATSYMPHHAEFSIIRELVVKQSAAIFQDDSGIPFKFFADGRWDVQLYGDYTKPYGSFSWLEQSDLRKAYQTSKVKPLSLRLGYGFGKVTSNLLLAKKKEL
jgi:hypothetical protein